MLSPHHITMQDVALAAGVHQTTVSLALRNDPRLPEKTRLKIQALAEKLGYRPDPMLAALNFYRASRHVVKAPPTMAFLLNLNEAGELAGKYPLQLFLEGARAQATQLGYHLDVFYVGREAEAGRQTQRILRARGITGVIVAAFLNQSAAFDLDWPQVSAVAIESQQLRLSLHTISTHQQAITREAIRRLRELGYRRIGLAAESAEDVYLRNAYTAGYYVETSLWPDLAAVPPLIFRHHLAAELAQEIGPWVKAHRIEAVISNWNNIPAALSLAGIRVPREVAVASLDVIPGSGGSQAGMRQNHRIVGERAVEQLASLMRSHIRGLVEVPNTTLIDGEWTDPRGILRRPAKRHSPLRQTGKGLR